MLRVGGSDMNRGSMARRASPESAVTTMTFKESFLRVKCVLLKEKLKFDKHLKMRLFWNWVWKGSLFYSCRKWRSRVKTGSGGEMGWVRLNSPAQCGLGGVPVSEDAGCPPPPPCEAFKHALCGKNQRPGRSINEARIVLSKMTPNITVSNSVTSVHSK